jgi:hypothetical protein
LKTLRPDLFFERWGRDRTDLFLLRYGASVVSLDEIKALLNRRLRCETGMDLSHPLLAWAGWWVTKRKKRP